MKSKFLLYLALVRVGGLFGCSSISIENSTKVEDQPPVTLGFARVELSEYDTNAVPASLTNYCHLSFIWVEGKHTMNDAELWCGEGEKYSGKFIFRVEFADGKTMDTPLESLCPDGCFDFIYAEESQPWQIKMADYNNDGQPDFNIVTYAGCNLSESHLFTITLSGKI